MWFEHLVTEVLDRKASNNVTQISLMCHSSKPSHAHDYAKKEIKLFQQLVTQFAQVSPLGQGNNSYRQVNYCAEIASVLPLIPQDTAEPMEAPASIADVAATQHSLSYSFL